MITSEAAEGLAAVILCNTNLQDLDLSYNYLQSKGVIKVVEGMKHITTLKYQVI